MRDYPFNSGFAVPTGSKVAYGLGPTHRRFVAVLGLAHGWKGVGPYRVLVDGQPVWTSQNPDVFARNEQAYQLNIAIPADSKQLTLTVEGTDCYAAWAVAGFLN
ncbi:unnamed protein product [marine sediment metagenome]|uniref:Glycosyl hydrolase family 98 putative carbohydrate-binding module domain-containing protein n=1 Tax=marine sediment metagenome TaxID=412755 RepID=X1D1R6_9ZZZZ